jgi:hypothetical protein
MIFVDRKNGRTTKFFTPPLLMLLLDQGSEIRDTGSEIRDESGPGIRDKHPGSATLQIRMCVKIWKDIAELLERLTANDKVTTGLGSIPASADTVESE